MKKELLCKDGKILREKVSDQQRCMMVVKYTVYDIFSISFSSEAAEAASISAVEVVTVALVLIIEILAEAARFSFFYQPRLE